jgi:hypothetical protein
MASSGEIDENLEIYIGKRCQVKANNQRGLVVGVIKNAGRPQIEVELDGEGMSYGTYISKLFIEDEKYKYPPYERTSQRDNSFKRQKQVPTTSAISVEAIQSDRNETEQRNNDPLALGGNIRNRASLINIRNNSTVARKRGLDPDEENHSESDESDSNSDDEDLSEISTDGWTNVEKVTEKLNAEGPVYRGGDTIFKWNSAGITFAPGDVKRPIDYFRFMFPMGIVNRVVAATNVTIPVDDHITADDFWKYIGIRMAFVLQPVPFGIKDGAFGEGVIQDTLFERGEYGRKYGMSRNRFMFIDANLKFIQFTEEEKRQV